MFLLLHVVHFYCHRRWYLIIDFVFIYTWPRVPYGNAGFLSLGVRVVLRHRIYGAIISSTYIFCIASVLIFLPPRFPHFFPVDFLITHSVWCNAESKGHSLIPKIRINYTRNEEKTRRKFPRPTHGRCHRISFTSNAFFARTAASSRRHKTDDQHLRVGHAICLR